MADVDMQTQEKNPLSEIIATMSEEEIAALKEADEGFDLGEDDQFDPVDVKTAKETIRERLQREAEGISYDTADGDATEDKAEGEEAPDKAMEEAAAADAAARAAEEAPAAQAMEEATKPDAQKPAAPEVSAETYLEAVDRATKAAEAQRAEITAKYEEMEITAEEFKAKMAEIDGSIRQQVSAKVAEIGFEQAVHRYLTDNPSLNNEAHMPGLNLALETIDRNPLFDGMSDYDKLAEAHKLYAAQVESAIARGRNIPPVEAPGTANATPDAPKTDATTKAAEDQPKPPAAQRPGPPKTLARAPSSDLGGDGGKKEKLEKVLDSGDPDAIERALLAGHISTTDLEELG